MAMASDTTRHAGLGLHNRRLQVRFLSHLPRNPEFMQVAATWYAAHIACFDPMRSPFDTTRSNTADI